MLLLSGCCVCGGVCVRVFLDVFVRVDLRVDLRVAGIRVGLLVAFTVCVGFFLRVFGWFAVPRTRSIILHDASHAYG